MDGHAGPGRHARGVAQFSAFQTTAVDVLATEGADGAASHVRIGAHDQEADLDLELEIEVAASGLLRTRATLTNRGTDAYGVDSLLLALPTPRPRRWSSTSPAITCANVRPPSTTSRSAPTSARREWACAHGVHDPRHLRGGRGLEPRTRPLCARRVVGQHPDGR